VQITLIDRQNFHTFQPLLYQVATAGLSPGEIAAPIRWIMRSRRNVEVLMSEVQDFDLSRPCGEAADGEIPYDYLLVASGASHAYLDTMSGSRSRRAEDDSRCPGDPPAHPARV